MTEGHKLALTSTYLRSRTLSAKGVATPKGGHSILYVNWYQSSVINGLAEIFVHPVCYSLNLRIRGGDLQILISKAILARTKSKYFLSPVICANRVYSIDMLPTSARISRPA